MQRPRGTLQEATFWAPSAECEVSVLFCLTRGRLGCARRRSPGLPRGLGNRRKVSPPGEVFLTFSPHLLTHPLSHRRQLLGREGKGRRG